MSKLTHQQREPSPGETAAAFCERPEGSINKWQGCCGAAPSPNTQELGSHSLGSLDFSSVKWGQSLCSLQGC